MLVALRKQLQKYHEKVDFKKYFLKLLQSFALKLHLELNATRVLPSMSVNIEQEEF